MSAITDPIADMLSALARYADIFEAQMAVSVGKDSDVRGEWRDAIVCAINLMDECSMGNLDGQMTHEMADRLLRRNGFNESEA